MATTLPMFTAMNVSSVSAPPSAQCVQWSSDGQVFFTTKTELHILTPSIGINIDAFSHVTGARVDENEPTLTWFKTMIEFVKVRPFAWSDLSREWSTVSLGSLDFSLRSFACSPSNLTATAGCVIATLSSNMDLTLWMASKTHLKGEWIQTQNITQLLVDNLYSTSETEEASLADLTIRAQTVSIAWSSQADFGVTPAPIIDGSLFITGNRAGYLTFFRFDGKGSVEYLEELSVTSPEDIGQWITHICVSPWSLSEARRCSAYIAYATSDGTVGTLKVTQDLLQAEERSLFSEAYKIHAQFSQDKEVVWKSDQRGVTALSWVQTSVNQMVLAFCKPGRAHIWYPQRPSDRSASKEPVVKTFSLETQRLSVGSTCLSPVSGIQYTGTKDAIIISLSDGSFHAINAVSDASNVRLSSTQADGPLSSAIPNNVGIGLSTPLLSRNSRKAFIRAESVNEPVTMKDVNSISGMALYNSGPTVMWAHEATQPSNLSYKHYSKHHCMFVVASMWEGEDDEDQRTLQGLQYLVENAQACYGDAPIHLLNPYFFYFSNPNKLQALHSQIMNVLDSCSPTSDCRVSIPDEEVLLETGLDDIRTAFRHNLRAHLFGYNELVRSRLALSFADFTWKHLTDEEKRTQCGAVAQKLLGTILHTNLKVIIRHLMSVSAVLKPDDIPFVLRIVVQALLPGSPDDLSAEAQQLSALVHGIQNAKEGDYNMNELCPACNAEIPLKDINSASCTNGHNWTRCSVTSFILATPLVRTCIGCSRKTFLQLSSRSSETTRNWLPNTARGWVVEELLEAVNRCLYCGNRFVSMS